MNKATSEKVDEHEVATTERSSYTRPSPNAQLEDTKRTAKIPKVELETILRTESGTRKAVTPEAVARHVEERNLEHDLRAQMAGALVIPAVDLPEHDPHSRPTMEAVPKALAINLEPPTAWPPPSPTATPQAKSAASTAPRAPATALARPAPAIPRWVIPAMVVSLLLLVSAASTIGFVIGRMTGHH